MGEADGADETPRMARNGCGLLSRQSGGQGRQELGVAEVCGCCRWGPGTSIAWAGSWPTSAMEQEPVSAREAERARNGMNGKLMEREFVEGAVWGMEGDRRVMLVITQMEKWESGSWREASMRSSHGVRGGTSDAVASHRATHAALRVRSASAAAAASACEFG
eukprot:scaffold104562_cov26-Tisochrysis_lutea.AAC.1